MFRVEVGLHTYRVSYSDNQFVAKAEKPDGDEDVEAVIALAEIAYTAVKSRGEYAPSGDMIEFYTAEEMGVEMEQPEMESEPGVIY
jgi:hypothetical protein